MPEQEWSQEDYDRFCREAPMATFQELFDKVADNAHGEGRGLTYTVVPLMQRRDQAWEVKVWVLFITESAVEVLGGAQDGQVETKGWEADLLPLVSQLEQVSVDFNCKKSQDGYEIPPRIEFYGIYKGLPVCVTLMTEPPPNDVPAWQINANTREYMLKNVSPEIDYPCSRCGKPCDNLRGHYVIGGKDVCHRCRRTGENYDLKAR